MLFYDGVHIAMVSVTGMFVGNVPCSCNADKLTTDTGSYSPQHSKCEPVRSPVGRT